MNKETAKDYLPLVQALADGKVIQVHVYVDAGKREWRDLDGTHFDRAASDYRIKSEPVGPDEVWIQQRNGALWAYPEERDGSIRYVRAGE